MNIHLPVFLMVGSNHGETQFPLSTVDLLAFRPFTGGFRTIFLYCASIVSPCVLARSIEGGCPLAVTVSRATSVLRSLFMASHPSSV